MKSIIPQIPLATRLILQLVSLGTFNDHIEMNRSIFPNIFEISKFWSRCFLIPRKSSFFSETFDRSCATVEEQRFGWESGKIYREVDPDSDSKYLREVEEVYCSKGTQLLCSKYRIIYGNYVGTRKSQKVNYYDRNISGNV